MINDKTKLKIAIDLRPLTSERLSGVEMYIFNIVKSLLKIDKKNIYILYINSKKDFSNLLNKFKRQNVIVLQTKIPSKLMNLSLILLSWPKLDKLIFKKTNIQPDIFFIPDIRPTPLTKKTKKITVIHDLAFIFFKEFYSKKSRLWFKLINPKRELKESKKLIAVSLNTAKDIVKVFKVDKEKIITIYEACNVNLKGIKTPKTIKNIPKKYFLSLGTLEPRKNLNRLIEAYKLYKKENGNDVKLVIVGKFNEKAFAKLKLDKDDDIFFTGFVSKEKKAYLLKNAEALIYPSLYEGFGLPILEAMIFNTPVITSNVSSMPEVVGDSGILINPLETKQISDAMKEVLSAGKKEELKEKMKERVKLFSWEKCAKETLETIEKCVINN